MPGTPRKDSSSGKADEGPKKRKRMCSDPVLFRIVAFAPENVFTGRTFRKNYLCTTLDPDYEPRKLSIHALIFTGCARTVRGQSGLIGPTVEYDYSGYLSYQYYQLFDLYLSRK